MKIFTISQLPAKILTRILLELADLNDGRRVSSTRIHRLVFLLDDPRAFAVDPSKKKPDPDRPVQHGSAVIIAVPEIDETSGQETGRGTWHFDRFEAPDNFEFPAEGEDA